MQNRISITVDEQGRAILPPPKVNLPVNDAGIDIAPWTQPEPDVPPPVPPKQSRSFGFSSKTSFSRQLSNTNLAILPQQQQPAQHYQQQRPSRPSESHSLADSCSSSNSTSTVYQNDLLAPSFSSHDSSQQTLVREIRKVKSSKQILMRFVPKSRSRSRLASDASEHGLSHSQQPPLPETYVSFLPIPSTGPPSPTFKKDSKDVLRRSNKKGSSSSTNLNPPQALPSEPDLRIDMNFEDVSSFVNLEAVSRDSVPTVAPYSSSSPSSGAENTSDTSHLRLHSPSEISSSSSSHYDLRPSFFDPFDSRVRHAPPLPNRKISPTSRPSVHHPNASINHTSSDYTDDSSWIAPESWVVDKKDLDSVDDQRSSSDEDVDLTRGPLSPSTKRISRMGQRGKKSKHRPPATDKNYRLRIYRANGSYHFVSAFLNVTVADLMPRLINLLSDNERVTPHRLYIKEKGRERILALTERPADIVRRRLEQAGYEASDGPETLAELGVTYLLKFVFKSQLLGPAEEEPNFDSYTNLDLSSKSLRTIPVALHAHADAISSLDLSRNPMLEIPLDFIQSCTRLITLQLVNMAIKKVPSSVRHSSSLQYLDISSNRISDLNDAGLDRIEDLESLYVQNNKMETLPWYFPRLRALRNLNISNNKFKKVPAVISEMVGLVHLDISFNTIQELPSEIGQLRALETFILVGNQIGKFPETAVNMDSLQKLDCRRNNLSDLTPVCMLPHLEVLMADHNIVHALDLCIGPRVTKIDASHNDITQISLPPLPGPVGKAYTLVSLDISYAKLSSLDDLALSQLSSLQALKLDHNSFKVIPETLGELSRLVSLSCCYNLLEELPASIGNLQKLEFLDAHSNSLKELPKSIWNCCSLLHINLTSNLLTTFHDPPPPVIDSAVTTNATTSLSFAVNSMLDDYSDPEDPDFPAVNIPGWIPNRKTSATSFSTGRPLPPLAYSLEKLYLGENQITDESLQPLFVLRELRILNLSFNQLQDLPQSFFTHYLHLEQLYLSGNYLKTLPTEDLVKVTKLSVLFLNGNKLETLPQELGKVQNLAVLDVGSNALKYNINNWEFDWNWNFNTNLHYLNLSGNKRLHIKSDVSSARALQAFRSGGRISSEVATRKNLSGFTALSQLRVLGLMDVTMTSAASGPSGNDLPDESEERRVRTSQSTVNGMSYGIADNLVQHKFLNMFDLVHEFRGTPKKEAIFAMFGRAQPVIAGNNLMSKWLHDNFLSHFSEQLHEIDTDKSRGVQDALRRAFLKLNKDLHDTMYSVSSSSRKMSQASASTAGTSRRGMPAAFGGDKAGASGIVIYFVDRTMYVANVGNFLAVVCRRGQAHGVARKHEPFDRAETARIRAAEGWVSPEGLVNGDTDISRSFGFFGLLPIINARPDIHTYELSDADEFVIVANRGLWDHVPFQIAVDIARPESHDPMTAAAKLRDFAVSYGADGSTMIMVIGVGDGRAAFKKGPKPTIKDRNLIRLPDEVDPPQGHLALAFTDITNSTHLWEVNPGMNTAMKIHNNVLRRQLRLCGGYEVKTEGDSFMCSFPTALAALWWCLSSQVQLLHESWPLEILECDDGKEVRDSQGRLIYRGLSVRMGIHCGMPLCEPDPNTGRMDYFGPMVNRSARIEASANGGQVMCSADVIREINAKILQQEPDTDYPCPEHVVDAVKHLGVSVVHVGEHKLKGLEVPEVLSVVYPAELEGRREQKEQPQAHANVSGSRVQFSVAQMRELGMLVLRLEALSTRHIFRPLSDHKIQEQQPQDPLNTVPALIAAADALSETQWSPSHNDDILMYADPDVLLPKMDEKSTDGDLMMILDNFSIRIANALANIASKFAVTHGTTTTIIESSSSYSLLPVTPTTASSYGCITYPTGRDLTVIDLLERARAGQLDERTLERLIDVMADVL